MSQTSCNNPFAASIFETVPGALLLVDTDLRVVAMNEACCRLFGVAPEEANGSPLLDCCSTEWDVSELHDFLEELLPKWQAAEDFEVKIVSRSRGRRLMVVNARRLDYDELILLAVEDATGSDDVEQSIRQRSEQLETRVNDLMREVNELTRKVERVKHQERRRISEILHDDIQQRIYGIGLRVGLASQDARAGKIEMVLKHLAGVQKWLDESVDILRQLTADLSPARARRESLASLFSNLAAGMNDLHGLNVELRATGTFETSPETRLLLYQTVRELLFNVVKHSGVHDAVVEVRPENESVEIRVMDRGSGFDPKTILVRRKTNANFGLANLRKRLNAHGASMTIDSAPGRGTRVTVRLPLHA